MEFGTLIQIVVDLFLFSGLIVLGSRLLRKPQDDPRLSRGLQLLQSKISVLEDLSDRTDVQVKQLMALLDKKCLEIQNRVHQAQEQVRKIELSMDKSLEVAQIFQDRIPHSEIIERQRTQKYVLAAKLANQGKSFEEISQEVDLPMSEIELITKINKDQLMFCEESLPAWMDPKKEMIESPQVDQESEPESISQDFSQVFEKPKQDLEALNRLGEKFREAIEQNEVQHQKPKEEKKDGFLGKVFHKKESELPLALQTEQKNEFINKRTPSGTPSASQKTTYSIEDIVKKARETEHTSQKILKEENTQEVIQPVYTKNIDLNRNLR